LIGEIQVLENKQHRWWISLRVRVGDNLAVKLTSCEDKLRGSFRALMS